MKLFDIPFDKITKQHLQDLIDNRIPESRYIDYKSETYNTKNQDSGEITKGEYLADISSFANGVGGDIIIGMDEDEGIPTKFTPFKGNIEEEINRLEKIAKNGMIEPSVVGILIKPVQLDKDEYAIVIRIPRSIILPHRITLDTKGAKSKKNTFWVRGSAQKYEPDVFELRQLFNMSDGYKKRIQELRTDRLSKINSGDVPVRLKSQPFLVIHLFPFSIDDMQFAISLDDIRNNILSFDPQSREILDHWIDFDGVVGITNDKGRDIPQNSYIRIFHTGEVELVTGIRENIDINKIANDINSAIENYLNCLFELGIQPPISCSVSLLNTNGCTIRDENSIYSIKSDRDQYDLPSINFDKMPQDNKEYRKYLLPIFNRMANIIGKANFE
jgi:hypothetical protein